MVHISARIRAKLREALDKRKLSQRIIANRLTSATGEQWSQPRVGKVLNGRVELKVDDMALLADLAGVSLVDLVRVPDREFVADLTPTELKVIHAIRDHPDIMGHIAAVVSALTAGRPRPTSRAVIRERMRQAQKDD